MLGQMLRILHFPTEKQLRSPVINWIGSDDWVDNVHYIYLDGNTIGGNTNIDYSYGNRRELKWQMALYVGLIRWAMFINIWIVAMQRISTNI